MSIPDMQNIWLKTKEFLLKYEYKIVLIVAICLISAVSYEFGILQGQKWQQKPLIIEKPIDTPDQTKTGQNEASDASENALPIAAPIKGIIPATTTNSAAQADAGCAYVGSKNSNKFYLPTCSYAKRVKPENLTCFKTAEEATGQGRTESTCK